MFGKAITSFRENGCVHPMCFGHGRTAKMRMVKHTNNKNYGRPFLVCSERDDPCAFWQWGDIFEGVKPVCQHNLICRTKNVKKEGPNQGRLFYCCPHPRDSACDLFAWKPEEDPHCMSLGSNPYQEFLNQKELDELIQGFTNLQIS